MSKSNIRQLRISEKNSIHAKLIEMKSYLKNKKQAILRFSQSEKNLSKIPVLKEEAEKLEEDIRSLYERVDLINAGKLDEEISESARKNNELVEEKKALKKKKKELIEKDKAERKKKSMDYYNKTRSIQREERYEEKNKNYYQKYFFKVEKSIPGYLLQKLNKMPNNKGYIFRDVYLYGRLPCDKSNKTTLFETKNKVQYIHEWDKNTGLYSLYEKQYRSKPVLLEQRPRSLIKNKINAYK